MNGCVITVTSGKGGVGKTTTTANIGIALAKRGKSVVCVDTDLGLRNLDLILGLEEKISYDLVEVIEGHVKLRQALIKDQRVPGLYLLAASPKRDKSAINERQLTRMCLDLRKDFDFVMIDSPAGIEHGYRNAVAPADQVLIVTTPEVSAVRDADRVIGLLEAAHKPPPRLIINRLRPGLARQGDMMATADILELLNIPLIGIIPEDEGIIAATNIGHPITFDPRSPASKAFHRIARRILGEELPIPNFENLTILDRFTNLFRSAA